MTCQEVQIGDRVRVASKGRGVVRWIGHLSGLESVRAGIELYSEFDSCHSGEFNGVSLFPCGARRGVFVKLSRLTRGISLADAIAIKYRAVSGEKVPAIVHAEKSIKITLVGEEKATKYFAENVFDLNEMCVDGLDVCYAGEGLECFTQLQRLSVRESLLANLDDVVDICNSISGLKEIDVSGSVFSSFLDRKVRDACRNITCVVMSDCRFDSPSEIAKISESFPNLKKLVLDNTHGISDSLSTLPIGVTELSVRGSLESSSWTELRVKTGALPCALETIDLSDNLLGDIDGHLPSLIWMKSIKHLGVAQTGITQFRTIAELRRAFSSLESLRITENPFYESSNIVKSRQILIAIFPFLTVLNSTVVSPRQREEAEKYVASLIVRKDELVLQVVEDFRKNELLEKFSVVKEDGTDGSFSLAPKPQSNMMKLTLHAPMGTLNIRVPQTARSDDFIAIVARKIQWPLKLSQLEVFVAPRDCPEDRVKVDSFAQQEIVDLGTCDGWHVFTALIDDRTP